MKCEKCEVELNEENICCEGGTCCKTCEPECKKGCGSCGSDK